MIRTQYLRTAFQIPFDSTVRISLDTNLTMIKENPDDGPTCTVAGRRAFHQPARLGSNSTARSPRPSPVDCHLTFGKAACRFGRRRLNHQRVRIRYCQTCVCNIHYLARRRVYSKCVTYREA